MGVWKVTDLDKGKTESSITNEQIRLKKCKDEFNRLINVYDIMIREHRKKEQELQNKLDKLYSSIKSGEKFIEEYQEYLKTFN